MLAELCPPALIYLIFSLTQIVIDTIKGFYNTAFLKIWVTFAFTVLLNVLCKMNLGIVAWIIVFIPFILMTLIISILLIMFGLDPSTGRSKVYKASSATRTPEKLIGGCGGTQFGCCADGTIPAKSLNDPCKGGGGTVPGVPQTPKMDPNAPGYLIKPIIPPPTGIQGAYSVNTVGPDGNPRGPAGEVPGVVGKDGNVPRDEFQKDNVPTSGGGSTSANTQKAMDNEKERRAHQPTHLDGEQPSERAGEANSNCQTFCAVECLPQCREWNCPSCKPKIAESAPIANENTNCGTFCKKGAPCTEQCRSWKCPNCIPPAPANLSQTCKTASSACTTACTAPAAQVCLVEQNYLDPRTECIGWAPCMILNKVNSTGGGASGAAPAGHGAGHGAPPDGDHGGGHGAPPPGAHGGGHGAPPGGGHGDGHEAMAAGVPAGTGKHGSVADNAGNGGGTSDKWASGFVQGGSAGESLDSYSTGGNRAYTSHGLAAQRAEDSKGDPNCPKDPRPNCGCATGLRLVNGVCAHQD